MIDQNCLKLSLDCKGTLLDPSVLDQIQGLMDQRVILR